MWMFGYVLTNGVLSFLKWFWLSRACIGHSCSAISAFPFPRYQDYELTCWQTSLAKERLQRLPSRPTETTAESADLSNGGESLRTLTTAVAASWMNFDTVLQSYQSIHLAVTMHHWQCTHTFLTAVEIITWLHHHFLLANTAFVYDLPKRNSWIFMRKLRWLCWGASCGEQGNWLSGGGGLFSN